MNKVYHKLIDDLFYIEPTIYNDKRGCFLETFRQENFKNNHFIQDNESVSKYGVLRGMHFQKKPYEQSKLVRVVYGEIQDVAIDLRPTSKTYKKYFSIILNDKNKKQLFIPKGFGHGFLTLSPIAIVAYKVDQYFNKSYECGIRYDDPEININWKLNNNEIILSSKDKSFSNLY